MTPLSSFRFFRATAACAILLFVAAPARADLLVSNFFSSTITRLDQTSGAVLQQFGPGTGLINPLAARVGPDGLLYVTSEGNNSVRRYNPGTGAFIDTFITSGSGGLTQPTGVTWAPDGTLLVTSFDQDTVFKFNPTTGAPLGMLFAPAAGALNGPDNGAVVGPDGVLYVPSYLSNRVLKYDPGTGAFLGSFATVARPRVILFEHGEVWVSSEAGNTVRRFSTSGAGLGFIGSGALSAPTGMAVGPDGSLYVASSGDARIARFDGSTFAYLGDFAGPASGIDSPVFLIFVVPAPAAALPIAAAWFLTRRRR